MKNSSSEFNQIKTNPIRFLNLIYPFVFLAVFHKTLKYCFFVSCSTKTFVLEPCWHLLSVKSFVF